MLKEEGKKIQKSIIDYLKSNGKLEVMDEYIIQELAMYYQIWHDAAKEVRKSGAVQVYKTGASNVSGFFVAMNKSSQNIEKICHKLGIYEIIKEKLHSYGKIPIEGSEFLK